MGFDKIIALGGAISAAALALNTINDIIGLVEERHQSGKSILSNQQKSLQLLALETRVEYQLTSFCRRRYCQLFQ